MKRPSKALAGALVLLAAACQTVPAAAPGPIDTREAMIAGINPAALQIWGVTNRAAGAGDALDPVRVGDGGWAELAEAADMLAFYSHQLSGARSYIAGGPDTASGQVPPGIASREEIQAMIDADPAGFRALSAAMGVQADELAKAVDERNPARTAALAKQIDAVCETCHIRYWYERD